MSAASSDTPLSWALAYAVDGLHVFPVNARRKPLVGKGFYSATNDQAQIKTWWAKWPHADVAAAVPDNVAVLDLDCKNGKNGRAAFQRLEKVDPETVEAPIATTPTGGLHIWTNANGRKLKQLSGYEAEGIDLRLGGRGYVVLPGANNGRQWRNPLSTPSMPPTPAGEGGKRASAITDWRDHRHPAETTPYGRGALDNACAKIRDAGPGERDATIGKYTLKIGSLIGGGEVDESRGAQPLGLPGRSRDAQRRQLRGTWKAKIERAIADWQATPQERAATASAPPKNPPVVASGGCERDHRGRIIPNLANLMIALRCDPSLVDVFAFDQTLHAPVLRKELPAAPNGKTTNRNRSAATAAARRRRQRIRARVHSTQRLPPRRQRHFRYEAINKRARELAFSSYPPMARTASHLGWNTKAG